MQIRYKCPVCGGPLERLDAEKRFVCRGGTRAHSFDIARQGYVNLLLPQKKGSDLPGDSKMMVKARTDFLEAGYYAPFSDILNGLCSSFLPENAVVCDAGCGEGYYTKRLASAMPGAEICGFDLSRDAVAHAAQSARAAGIANVAFGVASLFETPLQDASCDAVCCLFAPVAEAEFARIIKKGGYLFIGVPGEEHLWGLKSALYDKPYLNEIRRDEFGLFEPVTVKRAEYAVTLRSNADIMNLFRMTPYFWKTSERDVAKLACLDTLDTKLSFDVLVYRKK